jgi:hypothetical protein
MTRSTGYNTGLAKVAVQCSADTFVVNQSLVLRINICGENRHLRQARNRWRKSQNLNYNLKLSIMIWAIVIGIILFILFKFLSDVNQDNKDLQGQTVIEKFQVVISMINDKAFNGNGEIIPLDKRSFNLYQNGQNQIVQFFYSTGHLTIIWKYKYFQKEIEHKKIYRNLRNISIFQQQKMAENMIDEMEQIVAHHQMNVINEI